MNDPFDCQLFHELCMDYRGAVTNPQGAYERLQAYCRYAALSLAPDAARCPKCGARVESIGNPCPARCGEGHARLHGSEK